MTPVLVARGLAKSFGAREAVTDLSLELRAGETFALVGPNGAGKTTTLRMLAGLIAPTQGEVELNGRALTPASAGWARQQVGILTEAPGLWDRLTVRQNLTVYARLYGLPSPAAVVDAAMERFGVRDRARDPAAQLSKGLRQRVALARTLLHNPAVVLLDEPTSGLDPESARSVRELVRGLETEGRAVLICTHNLDEVERLATRVAVLRTRLLVVDTPEALRARYFGSRVRVLVRRDAERYSGLLHAAGVDDVRVEDGVLSVALDGSPVHSTPELVRLLVEAGAQVEEVGRETPSLEQVYLRVLSGGQA
jgi:ABC-2 type transport system ATP-binding protein